MNIEKIKEKYPVGTKIELVNMEGESHMEPGLIGEVTDVDDIGQIHMKWENGSSLALNTEVDSFKKKISVLLVQPGKYPKMIEIEDSLEAMQKVVDGYIEEYMPFTDDVAIVCNEEGKMRGLPLNRAITDENGYPLDIIAGDFFVAYAPAEAENFLSLPKNLAEKYEKVFKTPQKFYSDGNGIHVQPSEPYEVE